MTAVSSSTPITQYVHTAWRLEDGQFDGVPRAIAQTTDGYIWIATEAGVFRFDGVRFVPFNDVLQKAPNPSGDVWSLLGASDGSLWIGGTNHIYRWNGMTLSTFAGRVGRYVAMVEDHSGVIWAIRERVRGEREGGLCRPSGSTIACIGGKSGFFSSYTVAVGPDNSIWAANGQALFRFHSGTFREFPFFSSRLRGTQGLGGVTALAPDSEGGVWIGFDVAGRHLGLEHLQNGHPQPVRSSTFSSTDLKVEALLAEKDGPLWIGSFEGGIDRMLDGDIEHYGPNDGLSGDSGGKFFKDREGDLWVLTDKGIDRFRDASVLTYTSAQRLSLNYSDAALASQDGSIWAVTDTGADILRGQALPRLSDRVHLPGTRGTSILEGLNGDMWLGRDNDLYRIANHSTTRIRAEGGDSLGVVGRMAQDKQGNVWISIWKLQDDDSILYVVRPNEDVAQRVVTGLGMSDATIADFRSGIWILDRSGHIAHVEIGKVELERNEALNQKHPLGLMQGPNGTLYVWCKEGLVLIRGAEGRFIPDPQLASCQVHESIFDLAGALWARGKCGLIRVPKSEVEEWWKHPNTSPQPRLLIGAKDGLGLNWGDFSLTISRSPDGRLWLATRHGLQMVDPAHLYFNSIPPPVVIESLIADHTRVPHLASNDFPAGTRDFEIDYTALSFPNPAKVLFRYKLDGHDKEWQDVGKRRQAFYTNLTPGHYTFHVTACNDSGLWNEQGASFHFDIEPAWYQTLWFQLIAAALTFCMLLIVYIIRARVISERVTLRVSERMSERMRISRELHDTLLQAIQGIILRFSTLMDRVSPDVQEEMERSLNDTESLLVLGRDRIKELRGQFSDEADIALEIQSLSATLFANHRCKVSVETKGTSRPLKAIAYEEIVWIAREAMTNSCKHSNAEALTLRLSFTPSSFRMSIRDNGIGLGPDALRAHNRGHFGLVSMRERAEGIGGRLSVSSESGQGTLVNLSLPGRVAYIARRGWFSDLVSFGHR
ncbi:sensor histidine kinase [Occallatibacter riparius]|uniref:Histidine kinase n=1 Tax=Occallatibacter riparius TaxID=1002689 RepID=A0A9J7BQT3_9BACT|nr:sensor histidine kinase [Occallatibacter riparius]UWZ85179.1 histidine kinase [Occallatibacter riparius]